VVEVPETRKVKRQVEVQRVKMQGQEAAMPFLKVVRRQFTFDFRKLEINLRTRESQARLMNRRRLDMTPINLDTIQKAIDAGDIDPNLPITMKTLKDAKVVNKIGDGVKLLARVDHSLFGPDIYIGKRDAITADHHICVQSVKRSHSSH
jgi:hypothetical protein